MSKKSKALNKLKRLAKKRAIKAINKAKYAAWAAAGENTKSKRYTKTIKKLAKTISHPEGKCGNIGCKKCDPCKIY